MKKKVILSVGLKCMYHVIQRKCFRKKIYWINLWHFLTFFDVGIYLEGVYDRKISFIPFTPLLRISCFDLMFVCKKIGSQTLPRKYSSLYSYPTSHYYLPQWIYTSFKNLPIDSHSNQCGLPLRILSNKKGWTRLIAPAAFLCCLCKLSHVLATKQSTPLR